MSRKSKSVKRRYFEKFGKLRNALEKAHVAARLMKWIDIGNLLR